MPGVSPNAGAAARPTVINLVVAGAAGRMGTRIVACLVGNPDLRLVGALEAPAHPTLGRDAGELAGVGRLGVTVGGDPAAVITRNRVLVEFSVPEASLEHLRLVARIGARAVIGTTGFTAVQRGEIADLSLRSGDVAGEHTVSFGTLGERLELTHRAHSRDTFARGALRAVRFVAGRSPGLYSMQDALGLA